MLTQKEAAELFDTNPDTWSNWEKGRDPKYDKLIELADYFQVKIDDLLRVDFSINGIPAIDSNASSFAGADETKLHRIIANKEMQILEMGDEMKVAFDTLLKVGEFLGGFPVREEDESEKAELLRLLEGLKD